MRGDTVGSRGECDDRLSPFYVPTERRQKRGGVVGELVVLGGQPRLRHRQQMLHLVLAEELVVVLQPRRAAHHSGPQPHSAGYRMAVLLRLRGCRPLPLAAAAGVHSSLPAFEARVFVLCLLAFGYPGQTRAFLALAEPRHGGVAALGVLVDDEGTLGLHVAPGDRSRGQSAGAATRRTFGTAPPPPGARRVGRPNPNVVLLRIFNPSGVDGGAVGCDCTQHRARTTHHATSPANKPKPLASSGLGAPELHRRGAVAAGTAPDRSALADWGPGAPMHRRGAEAAGIAPDRSALGGWGPGAPGSAGYCTRLACTRSRTPPPQRARLCSSAGRRTGPSGMPASVGDGGCCLCNADAAVGSRVTRLELMLPRSAPPALPRGPHTTLWWFFPVVLAAATSTWSALRVARGPVTAYANVFSASPLLPQRRAAPAAAAAAAFGCSARCVRRG